MNVLVWGVGARQAATQWHTKEDPKASSGRLAGSGWHMGSLTIQMQRPVLMPLAWSPVSRCRLEPNVTLTIKAKYGSTTLPRSSCGTRELVSDADKDSGWVVLPPADRPIGSWNTIVLLDGDGRAVHRLDEARQECVP